jgi:hypothetical protein
MNGMARWARRTGVLVALVSVGVAAWASPAGAHGSGGSEPTNYETSITRVEPPIAGLRVDVVDLGTRLRLTNDTGRDVVVLGYEGEPYLRVGPRGAFENRRSPATYLNRELVPTSPPPAHADADAAPDWHKVSGDAVVSWHDHNTHWMGSTSPPAVQDEAGRRHVIRRWTVELRDGRHEIAVRGLLTWVPPPSPWPAAVVAVGVAVGVVFASRRTAWPTALVIALVALLTCALVHTVGHWSASDATLGTKVSESLASLAGIAIGVLALFRARRRGVPAAVPLVLVSAVVLVVTDGFGDIASVGHSQVASSLPPTVARLTVVLTIGLGIGLVVASALRLRPAPSAEPARASGTAETERGSTAPVTS